MNSSVKSFDPSVSDLPFPGCPLGAGAAPVEAPVLLELLFELPHAATEIAAMSATRDSARRRNPGARLLLPVLYGGVVTLVSFSGAERPLLIRSRVPPPCRTPVSPPSSAAAPASRSAAPAPAVRRW